MSQLDEYEKFVKDNGCILSSTILNNNTMSNSPHYINIECGVNMIRIPVSIFSNLPYHIEINGEIKKINTWDQLRKELYS